MRNSLNGAIQRRSAGACALLAWIAASVSERDLPCAGCRCHSAASRRDCPVRLICSGHADPPGIPLRTRPHPHPAGCARQPRRRRPLGMELGPVGALQSLQASRPDPDRHGSAPAARPAQAHHPLRVAVRGVQVRPPGGPARPRPRLRQLLAGPQAGPPSRLPAVQEARALCRAVPARRRDPGRGRRGGAAPHRPGGDQGADREVLWADLVGDLPAGGRPLVLLADGRGRATRPAPVDGPVVGVDRGITRFAACSDGTSINSPRAMERRLRILRRRARAVSRKQKGSRNHAKAVLALARCHRRVRNQRLDALHKATTALAKAKSVIVVEDLHVAGMVRNRHLARAISDQGWAEFQRQLTYKTTWYGSRLLVAPRFYPSKTCSGCGLVKADLNRDGFRAVFIRAAASVGAQHSGRLRARLGYACRAWCAGVGGCTSRPRPWSRIRAPPGS
jgi:IS605 OrfB family transposase